MKKVKVAIIGAGSGGLSARREVQKKTDDYVVIDGGTLGTTCARVGCMPSKVLIQVAEDFNRRKKYEEEGISGGGELSINSSKVMTHVRKLRDRFVRGVIGGMDSWGESNFIAEYATFVDANTLQVGAERI
jgi:dihydrolipoamide dehydrogenase